MSEHFFIKISRPPQGETQQSPQKSQRIRPKGPQRPQELRKNAEEQYRAPGRSHNYKAPKLTLGPAQQEEEHGPAYRQAVGPVQKAGNPRRPDPKGAQQIIQQPGRQPQENGLPEYQQLPGRLTSHAYPNRRPRNPARPLVLIGQGVDSPVHMELAPVQRQLPNMQVLPCDDQRPHGGGHDDAGLVKALHVLHAGDGQALPPIQFQSVDGGLGHSVIVHGSSLPVHRIWREGRDYDSCL